MKFAPPEIIRLAFSFLHFGHFLMASSTIRCSSSHACLHASHTYSYVGI